MYISSTLKWEQQKEIGGDECPQGNQVSVKFGDGDISAFLICSDVTTLTHTALSLTVKNFPGSSLIFLNLPKDWEKSSIEKAFGNIKAITTRYYSTGYFRIMVFPHDPNPFGQLSLAVEIAKAFGMNCEVAYYTTTVIQIKRGRGSVLTKTLLPFCAFSSTVDTTTRVKRGDLFSYSLKTSSKGGATSFKPWEFYGDLTELYGAEEGWVMDFCSGSDQLMNLSFAGCGFLGVYHLGVATCLTSHAPQFLKNITAFAGASAGSLVAAVLATSAPLNKCSDVVIELTDEARKHPLGPFNPGFDQVGNIRKGLELHLPSNSHKVASGRLFISVTSLKERKNVIISEFESKEDLIQVLLASCYIPFYAGLKFPQFKGQKWVDGGLSDNLPRLQFGRTIRISPFSGKDNDICPQDESQGFTDITFHNMNIYVNRENLQRELQIFVPPRKEGIESIVQLGYDDTLRFLQEENLCNYPVITRSSALPIESRRD